MNSPTLHTDTHAPLPSVWRTIAAGFCAILVGLGLGRFAYTPLIPAIIEAQWFSAADAAYLGAANIAGYLAGAVLARRAAERFGAVTVLRVMMLLATASFFACSTPLSYLWYFAWRFAAGLAGGLLMVLAAPAVLPHVPVRRRGLAGGLILTAVGAGIAASGTLVPLLLDLGLVVTWCSIGLLAAISTLVAWQGWPAGEAGRPAPPQALPRTRPTLPLAALYIEYALAALGQVPHMVFLVDFIARGLGRGIETGALYWVLFGIGALAGPTLFGYAGDRIGFRRALRLGFLIQAASVGMLAGASASWLIALSSLVVGAAIPGNVSLVLGRVQELAPPGIAAQRAAWGIATTAFAIGQAVAAYGYSFIFARTDGDYALLFGLGGFAFIAALAIDLVAGARAGTARASRRP
jgi:predicted MFS family arabinose efflux permease